MADDTVPALPRPWEVAGTTDSAPLLPADHPLWSSVKPRSGVEPAFPPAVVSLPRWWCDQCGNWYGVPFERCSCGTLLKQQDFAVPVDEAEPDG